MAGIGDSLGSLVGEARRSCRRQPFAFFLSVMLAGCETPIRTGAVIDRYSKADCVPVGVGSGIEPPTRVWNYTMKLRDGATIRLSGAQMPGGRIDVMYLPDGPSEIAANAGDYIYPADVRFDRADERLYVKASGAPAAFGGPQTWLFGFDLRTHRQTDRALVDPAVLPEQCRETP